MHEAEAGVVEVKIVVQTFARDVPQLEPFRFPVAMNAIRTAILHATEHADESLFHRLLLEHATGDRFLIGAAAGQIFQGAFLLMCDLPGRLADLLRGTAHVVAEVLEQKLGLIEKGLPAV